MFAVFLLLRPEALRIIQPAPGGVSSLKGYDALAVTSYLVTALSMATGAWLMGLQGPAIIGTVLMGIAVFLWIIRR